MAGGNSYQQFFDKGYRLENGVLKKPDTVYKEKVVGVSAKQFKEEFYPLKKQIIFNIDPIPKPRMTIGDRSKHRPIVVRYWNFKSKLQLLAAEINYTIGDCLDIEFHIAMPDTLNVGDKFALNGTPHKERMDIDNLTKAFLDCLDSEDKHIWNLHARKVWSYTGKIIINK